MNMEEMMKKLLDKFESMEKRFEALETKFDTLETKVNNIEQDVKGIKKDMATKKQVDILANQLAHSQENVNARIDRLEEEAIVDVQLVKVSQKEQ